MKITIKGIVWVLQIFRFILLYNVNDIRWTGPSPTATLWLSPDNCPTMINPIGKLPRALTANYSVRISRIIIQIALQWSHCRFHSKNTTQSSKQEMKYEFSLLLIMLYKTRLWLFSISYSTEHQTISDIISNPQITVLLNIMNRNKC